MEVWECSHIILSRNALERRKTGELKLKLLREKQSREFTGINITKLEVILC